MELELITSKEILEEITKKDINSIAFPDGAYNSIVKETVRKKDTKFSMQLISGLTMTNLIKIFLNALV